MLTSLGAGFTSSYSGRGGVALGLGCRWSCRWSGVNNAVWVVIVGARRGTGRRCEVCVQVQPWMGVAWVLIIIRKLDLAEGSGLWCYWGGRGASGVRRSKSGNVSVHVSESARVDGCGMMCKTRSHT